MMKEQADGTVGKALSVLDLVAEFNRPVRFSEILEQSPYPKATLYRLIQTLTSQRMLQFDKDQQHYTLGLRLVKLAHTAWQQSSLAQIAEPFVADLAQAVGETVHLAQLDGGQVLYVDKRNATRPVEMFSQAGKIGPAYCTGVGKVMLAYLSDAEREEALTRQSFHPFTAQTLADAAALRAECAEIRALGYGFDREEHEPGIICIAVPIVTPQRRALGAISVTSTTSRQSLSGLEKLVPRIQKTADEIANAVRSWRYPETHLTYATGN